MTHSDVTPVSAIAEKDAARRRDQAKAGVDDASAWLRNLYAKLRKDIDSNQHTRLQFMDCDAVLTGVGPDEVPALEVIATACRALGTTLSDLITRH